mgnify:CR=1 FL=1|jgi:hypothetical protein
MMRARVSWYLIQDFYLKQFHTIPHFHRVKFLELRIE